MVNSLVSIISGTLNRLPLLTAMLESVRADIPTGIPYEIILCDGGSTDGTIEYLRAQPDVKLIEHGERRGAITAFTDAGKLATGKYTVILNDDIAIVPGTIMRALVYLEENERCGMVAFADNRPVPFHPAGQYHTLVHPANENGVIVGKVYGQCCMVRTWLGQALNWWRGLPEQAFTALTYAGDNLLSSNILALGYTVDPVNDCLVNDYVHDDDLRAINVASGDADSADYYRIFPSGAVIADKPQITNPNKRQLRILYLPIYEPGFPVQKKQKRGLRDALAKYYVVWEFDYVAYKDKPDELQAELNGIMGVFEPDMLLTQLHGTDIITAPMLQSMRARWPRLVIVNWNGDYWPHSLTSPSMLELLRHVELQLTVNASVLPEYENAGIPAAYWQIGYEEGEWTREMVAKYDVVFLANAYSEQRKQLGEMLLELPCHVGLYGSGWQGETYNSTYDFAFGSMIYQHAKIAIGDNQFPDAYGFVSNRIFQALSAGGALLLHQRVAGLKELTGIDAGVHYVEWLDFEDLREKIVYYLEHESERREIAERGTRYVRHFHSFDARVHELFDPGGLMRLAKRQPTKTVSLIFVGALEFGGVMGKATGKHYDYQKGQALSVDSLDAPALIQTGLWRINA